MIFFKSSVFATLIIGASMLNANQSTLATEQTETTPQHLYKVISLENWEKSQSNTALLLSKDDDEFIHFSREDQLKRITDKYWANVAEYVVLKIDTNKLLGKLVYEANPGGASKYYHLYDGSIPLQAVIEVNIARSP